MNEHAAKWPTYLVEPNPGAMEKVLECFHVYIDKCDMHLLSSIQNSIYAPMIDKLNIEHRNGAKLFSVLEKELLDNRKFSKTVTKQQSKIEQLKQRL